MTCDLQEALLRASIFERGVREPRNGVALVVVVAKVNGEELKYKPVCKLHVVACQDNVRQGPGDPLN